MGHHHYAQNLLGGLSEVDDLSTDVFFLDVGEEGGFPGVDSMTALATTTQETRVGNALVTLLYHVRFLVYLLTSRPDVVHFNTIFRNQYHTYGLTVLAKATGARVVRTVHEVTADRLRDVSNRERRVAYRNLRTSDHIIVHSEDVKEDLRSEDVSTPTTVLPHGNYLFFREFLDPDAAPPLPTNDEPVVLFFGPKWHKGIDLFADALTEVETSFTTWIVGPVAEDAEEVVRQIESEPNVYVDSGYVPDEQLPDYFDHADIVVLPYRSGTTSGAVHLARAFENAVITSDLPCFTDVVDHQVDGYVLEETTQANLAKALDELVSDSKLRQQLAVTGLDSERSSRFDWGRIASATDEIYEELQS